MKIGLFACFNSFQTSLLRGQKAGEAGLLKHCSKQDTNVKRSTKFFRTYRPSLLGGAQNRHGKVSGLYNLKR